MTSRPFNPTPPGLTSGRGGDSGPRQGRDDFGALAVHGSPEIISDTNPGHTSSVFPSPIPGSPLNPRPASSEAPNPGAYGPWCYPPAVSELRCCRDASSAQPAVC